ncbi:MAG: hypothetical protein IPN17_38120, partial [Deltaproteobacteria bacterium]|nr:hypothetical protein [Deltaproteobacteria bacterium]
MTHPFSPVALFSSPALPGIGLAIAKRAAAEGASAILSDVSALIAGGHPGDDPRGEVVAADLSKRDEVKRLAREAARRPAGEQRRAPV